MKSHPFLRARSKTLSPTNIYNILMPLKVRQAASVTSSFILAKLVENMKTVAAPHTHNV